MGHVDAIAASKVPLSEHIYQYMHRRIVYGYSGYLPGDRLDSQTIADELAVSKTPVIYAIRRLVHEGLVVVQPSKGTFVRQLSDREVQELFELLGQLEAVSIRLVAPPFPAATLNLLSHLVSTAATQFDSGDLEGYLEADRAFHRQIGSLAPNQELHKTFVHVQDQIYLASASKARQPGDAETAVQQHRQLLDVFNAGRPADIEQAIIEHWNDSYRRYMRAKPDNGMLPE